MSITSKVKDQILQDICDSLPLGRFTNVDVVGTAKQLSIDTDTYRSVIGQFRDLGLLEMKVVSGGALIMPKPEALDFLDKGGFQSQDMG